MQAKAQAQNRSLLASDLAGKVMGIILGETTYPHQAMENATAFVAVNVPFSAKQIGNLGRNEAGFYRYKGGRDSSSV